MSILNCVLSQFCCIKRSNKLLTCYTLPLDFGGRFLGQHFTHDVAPKIGYEATIVATVHYGVAAYAVAPERI